MSFLKFPAVPIAALALSLPALGQVQIQVSFIQPFGVSPGYISGRVVNVNPTQVRVAALIFVNDLGYYSKPSCIQTTTSLGFDGSFAVVAYGNADHLATKFALLVVPNSANVPCYLGEPGVPEALESQALAIRIVDRPDPTLRSIQFAGDSWTVKASPVRVGPGNNYFSGTPDTVFVDAQGRLHLKLVSRNGRWESAEVISSRPVSLGQYDFDVDVGAQLDSRLVLGAFSWASGERIAGEVDVLEIGKFGRTDGTNAQYVVQPYTLPGHLRRLRLPSGVRTHHRAVWGASGVRFESTTEAATIDTWDFAQSVLVPPGDAMRFRFNLWLDGNDPAGDGELEAIVSGFRYTPAPFPSGSGLRFVPVPPCRLVDTRQANMAQFGFPPLQPTTIRSFAIPQQQSCNIPSSAKAYSFNVTIVPPRPPAPPSPVDLVRLWAAGKPEPETLTVNSQDGRFKANAAIVEAGVDGAINVRSSHTTDLVLDINGYFIFPELAPQSLAFYPLPPCRVYDSRNANGLLGGPVLVPTDASRTIPVLSSNCGVPANAGAYSLNATAVPPPTGLGFLTLWPTGTPMPFVSTLNAPTGAITANAAIVPAGTAGSINAFVSGISHLVIDINGYFAPTGGVGAQRFFTVQPCRAVDTRLANGEFGGPVLLDDVARSYRLPLKADCNLPLTPSAYALSAMVIPQRPPAQGGLGYLTLFPTGSPQPFVSTLNALDGVTATNAALVPAGTSGAVSSFVSGGAQLILDVVGFFLP